MSEKQKKISSGWVEENSELLKKVMPSHVLGSLFYPSAEFYSQYDSKNPLTGLHKMASEIFNWLKISPDNCIIDFYNPEEIDHLGKETAGFYTKIKKEGEEKEKEVILINLKHREDPLAIGAILAHEIMHLYLFRENLRLENTDENELLTDLATLYSGLPILIINGMSKTNYWWLSIIALMFGMLYWRSERLAFGYFKPEEYGQNFLTYLTKNNLEIDNILGYINPQSRGFISQSSFMKSKNPTKFIANREGEYRKSLLAQFFVVVIVVGGVLLWSHNSQDVPAASLSDQDRSLLEKIDQCKDALVNMKGEFKTKASKLEIMESQLSRYESVGDIDSYNNLVPQYNFLLNEVKSDAAVYDAKVDSCNKFVQEYNK